MSRLAAWWAAQPRTTQLAAGVGVPAVALAAVYASSKSKPAAPPEEEGAAKPAFTVVSSVPPGPSFSALSQLTELYQDLDQRLEDLEDPPIGTQPTVPVTPPYPPFLQPGDRGTESGVNPPIKGTIVHGEDNTVVWR